MCFKTCPSKLLSVKNPSLWSPLAYLACADVAYPRRRQIHHDTRCNHGGFFCMTQKCLQLRVVEIFRGLGGEFFPTQSAQSRSVSESMLTCGRRQPPPQENNFSKYDFLPGILCLEGILCSGAYCAQGPVGDAHKQLIAACATCAIY